MKYHLFFDPRQGFTVWDHDNNLYLQPTKTPWVNSAWWCVNLESLLQNFYTLVGGKVDLEFSSLGIAPYKNNPWANL